MNPLHQTYNIIYPMIYHPYNTFIGFYDCLPHCLFELKSSWFNLMVILFVWLPYLQNDIFCLSFAFCPITLPIAASIYASILLLLVSICGMVWNV